MNTLHIDLKLLDMYIRTNGFAVPTLVFLNGIGYIGLFAETEREREPAKSEQEREAKPAKPEQEREAKPAKPEQEREAKPAKPEPEREAKPAKPEPEREPEVEHALLPKHNMPKWHAKYIQIKDLGYIPSRARVADNKILAGWCALQRSENRRKRLSNQQINLLNELNQWFW
jgi:hypothetical protein